MSELLHRTFRVSFDINITLRAIDDDVIAATQERMHPRNDEQDDSAVNAVFIARDRHLLQALLAHPATLQAWLLRRAAEAAEFIEPDDQTLEDLRETLDDATLIDQIQESLPAEDYQFFKAVCESDTMIDNTLYFEEAYLIRQGNFTIEPR